MKTALRRLYRLLWSDEADPSTELGRRVGRYRQAARSTAADFVNKGTALVVVLLSINLTISYLGPERFGVWMTIASLSALLMFLDLGVGNALTNHVAHCAAAGRDGLREAISGGIGFVALVAAVAGSCVLLVTLVVPWRWLINTDDAALLVEARHAATVFAVLFGLAMVANAIQKVFAGLQRSYESHLALAFGSLLAIIGFYVAATNEAGIPVLLSIGMGSQIFAAAIMLCILAMRGLFTLGGIVTAVRRQSGKLVHVGALFLLLQLGVMAGWGADNLIVSARIGPDQVAVLSVLQRVFYVILAPVLMLNAPLWGAYADAAARNDWEFIRRTLRRMLIVTLVASSIGSVLVIVFQAPAIGYLTHGSIAPSTTLVLLVAVWTVITAVANAYAMALNGTGRIGVQVLATALFVAIGLPLKIFAAGFGLEYFMVATICVFVMSQSVYLFRGLPLREDGRSHRTMTEVPE